MDRVELGGIPVEYTLTGEGVPVVLPHARPFVLWYRPLADRLRGHAVLRYRREPPDDPSYGIADDAHLCARLLAHLGLDRPHVVGHSYGGLVALELARQGGALRSLALLEPATVGLLAPEHAAARMAPLVAIAAADGPAAGMDRFLRTVCGANGPELLDRLVPGALTDALAHAGRFFAVEVPAAVRWSFAAADAERIDVPVLHVRGADGDARFAAGAAIVASWFPGATHHVVPGANHLLTAQAPDVICTILDRFWASGR